MEFLRIVTLLLNGLTLPLSLAFLVILLWFDREKSSIQSFAIFLFLVIFWHSATLLSEVLKVIDLNSELVLFFSAVSDIGLAGASVGLYVFVTSLIVAHTRLLRFLALASLSFVFLNNIIILRPLFDDIVYQFDSSSSAVGVSVLYFLLFDVVSIYLLVRYQRKIHARSLLLGLLLFIVGQGFSFLNPQLGISTFGLLLSGVGIVVASFSIVQSELIVPLGERISQVEAMQQISVSIMQRSTLELIVSEATQAVVEWLEANAAVVFLVENSELKVASKFELPDNILKISDNDGLIRQTLEKKEPILLENYLRDWTGDSDFVAETEAIGSVMSVPLFAGTDVVGVMMVISGRRSKLFSKNELELLEQLADQVAVAISHSQLFEHVARSHAQLHTVLESTYNPVIAVDKNIRIIFCNPSAKDLIYKQAGKLGNEIIYGSKRIPRDYLPSNLKYFEKSINTDGYFTYEYDFGSSIFVCRIAPLRSTQTDGWVAVLNDITKLRELDRMKNEMVRMTSHDLKNPIQAAVANLDLLREDVALDNVEAIESIDAIEIQLERMSRIIGGILDLERLEMTQSGYTELHNIFDILTQTVEEVEDYAEEKSIKLITNFETLINERIEGDFNQLKRAFVNLVENAIKFTPREGTVWIEGECVKSTISIKVRDNGVGISKELQERIFERFFRGQQDNFEHVSGSGLGLSFVKSIVERHDGTINVDSNPNEGSCFTINLLR